MSSPRLRWWFFYEAFMGGSSSSHYNGYQAIGMQIITKCDG